MLAGLVEFAVIEAAEVVAIVESAESKPEGHLQEYLNPAMRKDAGAAPAVENPFR